MSSITPIRDPKSDHLLTPENAALVVIDYQPIQMSSIRSTDPDLLERFMVRLIETAKNYNLPIILSTVNVATGINKDTVAPIKNLLTDVPSYDRTSINAWEDKEFKEAVEAAGRKKILMAALWTEACLAFPALDMMREGYEIYPVVDCVAGTSLIAHETALRRIEQAGAQLTSLPQILCELQRDWNRTKTVPGFRKSLFIEGYIA